MVTTLARRAPAPGHQARGPAPALLHRQASPSAVPEEATEGACPCGGGCPRCAGTTLQPKLAVSEPGDVLEQEADRVAEALMAGGGVAGVEGSAEAPGLQRCGSIPPESCPCHDAPTVVGDVMRSPGQPLDAETRLLMQSRFGRDFGEVRVHTDAQAAASARAVNALAYTVGSDIVFNAGQYAPGTSAGERLVAHELAHVVQGADKIIQRQMPGEEAPQRVGMGDLRLAEARLEGEERIAIQGTDAEFWAYPPNIRRRPLEPLMDEETGAVVGFRYGGTYWEIFDLEGNLVESGEVGLESPLIDPIDILAGGLTGLGRSLLGGGVRSAARGVAGRVAGATAARLGLRSAIAVLSRRALIAVRASFRAIRMRGALRFTATTAARMADPARRVPYHILQIALRYGRRVPDPQGVVGAFQYSIPMFRNGTEYTLDVVIREADRTILHFLYR
jgi:hypothetical protein